MLKFFGFAVFTIAFCSPAFSQGSIGIASKLQGFYIFTDSQPLANYDVVGEVTTGGHNDTDIIKSKAQYQTVRDYLIKSARKMNYTADGLILSLLSEGDDKAVIIKFREGGINNSQCKVNQYQGVSVFVDSEPSIGTEYVGTVVSKGKLPNLQYSTLRDNLIGLSKKEYGNPQMVVLKLIYGGSDTADVLKVKN